MNSKQINFFVALNAENKAKYETGNKNIILAISAAVLINTVFLLTFIGMNGRLAKEVIALEDFLRSDEVLEVTIADAVLTEQTTTLELNLAAAKLVSNYLDANSGFETNIYDIVNNVKPSTVKLIALTYNENRLSINCTTIDNNPPADYTKALEETGLFENVTYKGFTLVESDNSVVFPIVCELKAVTFDD